jgi:uncharacterized membrane protein YjfL (UPF0719 family)
MIIAADLIRNLLVVCILATALVGVVFLMQRQLSLREYLLWGLLTIFLPLVGPFLTMLYRPGNKRPARH